MQIRALEQELGSQLLDRDRRNVSLTAAGEVFLREARKVLSALNRATLLTQGHARGVSGSLSIGFITPTEYSFLPSLIRSFRQQFPNVALQLREAMTDTQIEDLRSGILDVGLLSGQFSEAGFESQEIMAEPLLAAIPQGHPLASKKGPLRAKRLTEEQLVMFPRVIAPTLFDEIIGFCRAAGFSPRIAQEARQTQTIISLVAAGLGIAIVPRSIRHLERKGVVYRSFCEETPLNKISVVWSSDQPSAAVINFVAAAQSAWRGASFGRRKGQGEAAHEDPGFDIGRKSSR
jgi:DNA-binding transcriptional LysR family regulator